jgi:hypothetical protein
MALNFVAVVHPPTSQGHSLPEAYTLTHEQLRGVATAVVGAPITFEHKGIFQAVDRTNGENGQLATREKIVAELDRAGSVNGECSPIGKVLAAVLVEPAGGLHVLFKLDPYLSAVEQLILDGHLTGVSLTHSVQNGRVVPLEVSLTVDPARAHSFIVYSTKDDIAALEYLRKLGSGDITDYSSQLRKPTRIMAASNESVQQNAGPTADQMLFDAVSAHPDPENRVLLMKTLMDFTKKVQTQNDELVAANADRALLRKQDRVGTSVIKSYLRDNKTTFNDKARDFYDEEIEAKALDNGSASDIQAAWTQSVICASMSSALGARPAEAKRVVPPAEAAKPAAPEDTFLAMCSADMVKTAAAKPATEADATAATTLAFLRAFSSTSD